MDIAPLIHRRIDIEGLTVETVSGGCPANPTVLFLHGWPETWLAFEALMVGLENQAHVVAIDLPGIGASEGYGVPADKRSLAKIVNSLIVSQRLHDVTLVGHDIGGMIAYAYLRRYPQNLSRAVIMNVAIPGVEPWDEVKRNPSIWHFAFHAVPELPEQLVGGRQAEYFRYFYDRLAAKPHAISQARRDSYAQGYSTPAALKAGFDWYRTFPRDEKDNGAARASTVDTPVLYMRGEQESGIEVHRYVRGLVASGLRDVTAEIIPRSGHFAPEENPQDVLIAIRRFMRIERPGAVAETSHNEVRA